MLTGSLDGWAFSFRVSFGWRYWCTKVLQIDGSSRVADSNLPFPPLGVVLNFPFSYRNGLNINKKTFLFSTRELVKSRTMYKIGG